MTALQAGAFFAAAYRHARYYRHELEAGYNAHRDDPPAGLAIFDEHWPQANAAFKWLAERTMEPDAAALCRDFVRLAMPLLSKRRPLTEQIEWLDAGIQAARLLDDRENELNALNELGRAQLGAKNLDSSRASYQEALTLARSRGYRKQEADALIGLGRVCIQTGDNAKARDYLTAARDIYAVLDDPAGLAWALQNLGAAEERALQLDAAEGYLRQVLELAEQLRDRRLTAMARRRLASINERRGRLAESHVDAVAALEISYTVGDPELTASCLLMVGMLEEQRGDKLAAHGRYQDALSYSYKSGNKLMIAVALINLAWATTDLGDYETAVTYHQQVADIYRSLKIGWRTNAALNNVGFLQVRLGRLDAAERTLSDVLRYARTSKQELHDQLDALLCLAWLELKRGDAARCARIVGLVEAHPPAHRYQERAAYLAAVTAELSAALPADALQAAREDGAAMSPEAALDEALRRYCGG